MKLKITRLSRLDDPEKERIRLVEYLISSRRVKLAIPFAGAHGLSLAPQHPRDCGTARQSKDHVGNGKTVYGVVGQERGADGLLNQTFWKARIGCVLIIGSSWPQRRVTSKA